MCVFQGLTDPAPFADQLEPATTPYKRVSMDEARQGTPRKSLFQLFFDTKTLLKPPVSLSIVHTLLSLVVPVRRSSSSGVCRWDL